MTAIVTGTDGRSYVHRMAGEVPVFVTGATGTGATPRPVILGHVRLVAWLHPVEAGARRARVRLPAGQIVEVAADAVCSAANIARAGVVPSGRDPAARLSAGAQARPWQCLYFFPEPQGQGALRGVAPQVEGSFASTSAATIGVRAACTAVP